MTSTMTSTMTSIIPFKKEKTLSDRKGEFRRICTKYPDMVPVICERMSGCTTVPESHRRKYLVPRDITMGQFKYVIRKRIEMLPDQALFVFVDNDVIAPTNHSMHDVQTEHADEDGFVYMTYSGESTFGSQS
jgi:GABA(A) receptor-associated protein